MSGSSRNSRPLENRQPGQEYWIYLPANLSDYLPARTSLNNRERTRDPWSYFEESAIGGPNDGLARFPPAAPAHPPVPLLLVDDPNPTRPNSFPPYYQPWYDQASTEQESKLSPEEQKQAVGKLRKQLYSPHLSNILKRLGTKSSSSSSSSGGSLQDDVGKRCAICLEDFEPQQFVSATPCNHIFHEECIVPWVKSQGKCPVCRHLIVEKSPPQRSRNELAVRRGRVERNLLF